MAFPISHLGPLGIGLLWAVVCDLKSRRIPNLASGFVFLSGLVACGVDGGVKMVLSGLAAFALLGGLLVLYLLAFERLWRVAFILPCVDLFFPTRSLAAYFMTLIAVWTVSILSAGGPGSVRRDLVKPRLVPYLDLLQLPAERSRLVGGGCQPLMVPTPGLIGPTLR